MSSESPSLSAPELTKEELAMELVERFGESSSNYVNIQYNRCDYINRCDSQHKNVCDKWNVKMSQ